MIRLTRHAIAAPDFTASDPNDPMLTPLLQRPRAAGAAQPANRRELAAVSRYAFDQGTNPRQVTLEELLPSTLSLAKV
jgi:hypothetical protein